MVACFEFFFTAGYRDPRFVSQPGDIYSTSTINIAIFDCEAKATSLQTGNEELLDVRFIRNGNFLDNKYHLPKRHDYVVKGELDYVVGLTVKPIELEDNGAEYQCQILIDDEPINMTSSIGRLTVAGKIILGWVIDLCIYFTHEKWTDKRSAAYQVLFVQGNGLLFLSLALDSHIHF